MGGAAYRGRRDRVDGPVRGVQGIPLKPTGPKTTPKSPHGWFWVGLGRVGLGFGGAGESFGGPFSSAELRSARIVFAEPQLGPTHSEAELWPGLRIA